MAWYIGLMSGTSLDGVDAVLMRADSDPARQSTRAAGTALDGAAAGAAGQCHVHLAMPEDLRAELLALNASGSDELHRAALAANALMAVYQDAIDALLLQAGLPAGDVVAIGAHGQTVRHRPGAFDGIGYTTQLMNGALLAERSGIDVVCDFRSRDVAAGGQGAPLLPAFHAACFAEAGRDVAVLNLGGIGNLSLLSRDGGVTGFDTGPGNVLLDLWCQRHRGQAFDADGAWAAEGRVDQTLLQALYASEPYFDLLPPKSSGRDRFNAAWLDRRLPSGAADAADVMSTLVELTVRSVVGDLQRHLSAMSKLLVCGGGTRNSYLMQRLQTLLGDTVEVCSTAVRGVPPDQVEALAFAWLARAHLARATGNLPAVTGARGARVLGAHHPAA